MTTNLKIDVKTLSHVLSSTMTPTTLKDMVIDSVNRYFWAQEETGSKIGQLRITFLEDMKILIDSDGPEVLIKS